MFGLYEIDAFSLHLGAKHFSPSDVYVTCGQKQGLKYGGPSGQWPSNLPAGPKKLTLGGPATPTNFEATVIPFKSH